MKIRLLNPIYSPEEKNSKLKFSIYIAKRYLIKGSKNNAINLITGISSLGIIAGAMAMFVVLSVFSGLREFSLSFVNDFDPDLKVLPASGKQIKVSAPQWNSLKNLDQLEFVSGVVEERALFTYDGKEQVAFLKGVDSNFIYVNPIQKNIFHGQWLNHETDDVVLGSGIGQKLSVGLFDYNRILEVYMAKPGKGTINRPEDAFNRLALHPVGFYFLNEEMSQKYVFCDIELSRELLEIDSDLFTAFEIKIKKGASETALKKSIADIFDNQVVIKNRTELNASLHRMLNTENLILYLILTLVLIVTLFTLIGALIMTILDKKSNLKTLFHLGASLKELRLIFLTQGFMICLAGALIGIVLGSILVVLQQQFSLFMITPSLPYPIEFTLENIFIVILTILTLGFLAAYIASSRVNEKLLRS